MGSISPKCAKFIASILFVCFLTTNVFAAAPGFSDGEVNQVIDTNSVALSIVSAITADTAAVKQVSDVISNVVAFNADASAAEVINIVVATLVNEGNNVTAMAAEIIVATMSGVKGADIIDVIANVVSAVMAASDASAAEVLANIVSSIPVATLDSLSVDFLTDQGIGLDMPAMTFLSILVENGITEISFSANTISASSDAYSSAINATQQSANDLGVSTEVSKVLSLHLFDQNNNTISNLGGEVTVSLPVKGNENAGAFFNETAGKLDIMPSRVRNGFIEFKTTHFSYYVLIEAPASVVPDFASILIPAPMITARTPEAASLILLDDTSNVKENADNKEPRTGIVIFCIFAAVAAVAVGSTLFVVRKRKSNSI